MRRPNKSCVCKRKAIRYKKDLEAEILKQWDLIREDALISLVKSLPNRIIDVISRKGSNIEY